MKDFLRFLLKSDKPSIEEPPKVTYDRVIRDRKQTYETLREMVAKLLYLKAKLDRDVFERRAALARLTHEARRAERQGQYSHAERLGSEAEIIRQDLSMAEEELERIRKESNAATHQLGRFREVIRQLERECAVTEGTLYSQKIRKALHEATGSFDAVDPNLERIRTQVARLQAETSLEAELRGETFDQRLRALPAEVSVP